LIVLWSWGGLLCAIALTDVKTARLDQWTLFRLCELVVVLALLVTLSAITWIWLGGKEESHSSEGSKADPETRSGKPDRVESKSPH
jgi:uncharacterized membrane protein